MPDNLTIYEEIGITNQKDIELVDRIIKTLPEEDQEIIKRYHKYRNLSTYEINAYKRISQKVKDIFKSHVRKRIGEALVKVNLDEEQLLYSSFDFSQHDKSDDNQNDLNIDYKAITLLFVKSLLDNEDVASKLSQEEYTLMKNFVSNRATMTPQTKEEYLKLGINEEKLEILITDTINKMINIFKEVSDTRK